jgi:chromosome transmission fidelity protein 1
VDQIFNLGETLISMIQYIPDGVVVFFPSYSYLSHVINTWKKRPPQTTSLAPQSSIWDRLTACKPAFLEPRATTTDQDPHQSNPNETSNPPHGSILDSYAAAIATHPGRGALLLSVVGGSLSEGINFSDRLGRAVLVIGLPFPNPQSAEWAAKAAYIESKARSRPRGPTQRPYVPGEASREFAENACMRAVNQCVGRAIRHRGDYAAIGLIDRRYGGERIRGKLPGWIRASLREAGGLRDAVGGLREFFAER